MGEIPSAYSTKPIEQQNTLELRPIDALPCMTGKRNLPCIIQGNSITDSTRNSILLTYDQARMSRHILQKGKDFSYHGSTWL